MSKVHILVQKGVEHINNERQLLTACDSPFINGLYASFQNTTDLYLLLEVPLAHPTRDCDKGPYFYRTSNLHPVTARARARVCVCVWQLVLGGDLLDYMEKNAPLKPEASRFYAGSVLCAFEYLHAKNIVYRDLKPENVMIDAQGHIKLVDFGFAKLLTPGEKTYTLCGSPEYMAPDVILKKGGHDLRCDWWSFGVLLVELVTGDTPFTSDDKSQTYKMVVKAFVDWPALNMPKAAKKLAEQVRAVPLRPGASYHTPHVTHHTTHDTQPAAPSATRRTERRLIVR